MQARSLIGVVPRANPETEAMFAREFAEKAKFNLEQDAKLQALREKVKECVAELGRCYWQGGRSLCEIKRERYYHAWKFSRMSHYVERELQMPYAKAKRLMMVVSKFDGHKDEVHDVGWSVLAEALPIVKAAGVATAIAVAKEGREAVRQWKEDHTAAIDREPSWRTIKVRVAPDVYEAYEEALLLAEENGLAQGATFPADGSKWQQFHGLVIAALENLRAEREVHAGSR
jgi:hypothetical protein